MLQEKFDFQKITEVTPMMKQYLAIKADHKDAILFYRMGDFYEMFFEDAVIASQLLGIALTKRGKHETTDIPMCGVPYHSSIQYLHKLINSGYKVAICEQMESPIEAKKRGYKAVVKREVVRIITAGTILEESLLDSKSSNYLVTIANDNELFSISWVDISTGEFANISSSFNSLGSNIASLAPKEILISEKLYKGKEIRDLLFEWRDIIYTQANSFFDIKKCENKIKTFYQINAIDFLGNLDLSQILSIGAILEYISTTQKSEIPNIKIPKILNSNMFMVIDPATRRNLELNQNTSGGKYNTLLSTIDNTKTNMGARLLSSYLSSPLIDQEAINKRLNFVDFFFKNYEIINILNQHFKQIGDIERSLMRLSSANASPRDINLIKNSLLAIRTIAENIELSNLEGKEIFDNLLKNFGIFDELIEEIELAIKPEVPFLLRDGEFINQGYNAKLDDLYQIKGNIGIKLANLKAKYIEISGATNLKITDNNVLGFFIETSPSHASKFTNEIFIHKQSLINAVRYSTSELMELENEIINSKDFIMRLEIELFDILRQKILLLSDEIMIATNSVAIIDVASSFAEFAIKNKYTRPIITDGDEFHIKNGRHAIVEKILKNKQSDNFIENDCYLTKGQKICLLTGPNMAGKSTFLRQNAIIAILAQIGSFVPADEAVIGIIDKIYSRVGAADDLAGGRSTFMVEMIETANILNNATKKSFIILDEIGRGTSTYDGVSIAFACLEFIHNQIGARTLFATHYHELNSLEQELKDLKSYRANVKEWDGNVIFLHKIEEGAADRSYGIHVAKLAGIPNSIIRRASDILKNFESKDNIVKLEPQNENELDNYLNNINLDRTSPIEALSHLVNLKKIIARCSK